MFDVNVKNLFNKLLIVLLLFTSIGLVFPNSVSASTTPNDKGISYKLAYKNNFWKGFFLGKILSGESEDKDGSNIEVNYDNSDMRTVDFLCFKIPYIPVWFIVIACLLVFILFKFLSFTIKGV